MGHPVQGARKGKMMSLKVSPDILSDNSFDVYHTVIKLFVDVDVV